MLTAFSGIPFSPFSREGKMNIWFLRSQPVSGYAVALAKAIGADYGRARLYPRVGVLQYIARLPMANLIIGVSLGIASSYALCIWGVLLDMARPMLDWTDQQKAIKSTSIQLSMCLSAWWSCFSWIPGLHQFREDIRVSLRKS